MLVKSLFVKIRAKHNCLTPLWFIGLIGALLVFPPAAAAHPLDELYQVTYAVIASNRVTLQLELYPGILIAPRMLALIDTNQDDTISEAESQAFVKLFLKDVTFEIDGRPAPLTPANLEFSKPLELRAGVGVIRFDLYSNLPSNHRGSHQLFYQNNHQPDTSVYLVNAIADTAYWVNITSQEKDVFQSSLHLDYVIQSDAPIDFGADDTLTKINTSTGVSPGQEQLTRYLYDTNLSPLFILIALGLSAMLGALHALTPGHGKTLVAAYLIGSRGTAGHAVALGSIVTFTHTASVIAIGLLALLASQFIVPNVLAPALEILSGILVVSMGLRLLWARWQVHNGQEHPRHHAHDHEHPHPHDHDLPEQVKLSDLLALGISGGLVPCPEALGIMLIAIGLNRILLGLGLIVAFSLGLAVVLIVIGILLVRSKSFLDRLGGLGGRWQKLLPLASAVIVCFLGLGIVAKGLLAYFG
ncbi:MAG: sulfite exporter TauE/SafE family protein [Chloroflexi bacterium]|nr:sulfite exporter TauE/SafE family protein [Chloroflexota bacterium]